MTHLGSRPLAAAEFARTPAERADIDRSWARSDRAFFAAGACHILAWRMHLSDPEHIAMIHLRPDGGAPGDHFYARRGALAFDFNGWSLEHDLVTVNTEHNLARRPGWDATPVAVEPGLVAGYWQAHHHRGLADYPGDVAARADRYLAGLIGDGSRV